MRIWAAAMILALAGCSPGSVAPSPTPAATTTASVPDSTLSVLGSDGMDCVWRQVDPVAGIDRELLRVPGNCASVRLAWSPDGSRAVLRASAENATLAADFNGSLTEQAGRPSGIWEVETASGKATALALPPGENREVAYGPDSELYGFTWRDERAPSPVMLKIKSLLGLSTVPDQIGTAQRYSSGNWVEVERSAGPAGVTTWLHAYQNLGPRWNAQTFTLMRLRDAQLIDRLNANVGRSSVDAWQELPGSTATRVFWRDLPTDIRVLSADRIRTLPPLQGVAEPAFGRDVPFLRRRGAFLAIGGESDRSADLYDLERSVRYRVAAPAEAEVDFWPQPVTHP